MIKCVILVVSFVRQSENLSSQLQSINLEMLERGEKTIQSLQ